MRSILADLPLHLCKGFLLYLIMKYPTPKQVSEFARQYEQIYVALTQCKSAYETLRKPKYQIHGQPVSIEQVSQNDHMKNVVNFEGEQHDVINNGWGDTFIYIDGKKRYLEEI